MATREEIGEALKNAHAAGDTEAATKLADAYAATPAAAPNPQTTLMPVDSAPMYRDAKELLTNIGGGIASGAGKLAAKYGMALPNAVRDIANRQIPGTTSEQLGAAAEQAGPAMGADPSSLAFKGAKAVPELVATTAAMAPGVNAIAGALPRAMGRMRPLVADVGVNAGYEGARAGSEGQGITDVVKAAGIGGLGAGAGHVVGGLAQRGLAATPIVRPAAKTLLDNDILPTYGQALGRGASGAENALGYAPIIGPAIDMARSNTLKQYSRAEVNRALEPLGKTTSKIGEDAVEEGRQIISRSYNEAVPQTHIPAIDAQRAISKTQQSMQTLPLLSDPQIATVNKYITDRIQPELSFSQQTGNRVPGRTAKEIDEELGNFARKYGESTNPADHPMGEAFKQLRDNMRDVLAGNTAAVKRVRDSDVAFRELMASREAAKRAGKDVGEFNPTQMFQAAGGEGMGAGTLNRAARELLPTSKNAWRTMGQVGGLGAGLGIDPVMTLAGTALAHGIYSQPVRSLAIRGVGGSLPKSVQRQLAKLPFTAAQLAAQVGREASQ